MEDKNLGVFGEKIASAFLKRKGYKILEKNYSSSFLSGPKRGEIDIVAKKDGVFYFCEVKTSAARQSAFPPEIRVTEEKKRKIIRLAEEWLARNKFPLDCRWQVDVIAVNVLVGEKKAKIRHFPDVAAEN